MVVNIIVNSYCAHVRCTQKVLKETETKETVGFFVTFLLLLVFQLGGPRPPAPLLATPMTVLTALEYS